MKMKSKIKDGERRARHNGSGMSCSTPCTLESSREYMSSSSPPFSSTNATKMLKASLSMVRPASKNAAWTCLFTVAMVLRPSAPAQVTGTIQHQSQQWCLGQQPITATALLHTLEIADMRVILRPDLSGFTSSSRHPSLRSESQMPAALQRP